MSASTIAIDMPPGEHTPVWFVPLALALGITCWIGVGLELTRATPSATDTLAPPQIAASTAPTSEAAPREDVAPQQPRPTAASEGTAVASAQVGATSTCAPVTGFAFAQGGASPGSTDDGVDAVTRFARRHPEQTVTVEGYASAEGSPEVNLRLSHERAQVIARQLEKHGLASERVLVQAYGEYRPSLQGRGSDEDRRVIVRFPGLPECPQETPP
ncbi:MAG: OmpA family protein [Deltaproteobacteria bacterium]|nr:OmpA family protein [Deltaproteobacteria bacterium]MBK8716644.1 OmpA family protein [Deltaproteobacteria bacterium]MBP7290177.1 OmpA family protein [Nannocystaceae bacterium]